MKKIISMGVRTALYAVIASGAALLAAVPGMAQQPVKIGVGGSNFLNLTYYYLTLPGPLGYWKEEGFDVDVFPVSGSTEAAQQLAVNNLDFAEMNASVIIQSNTEHDLPIRAVITNGTVGWGLAVKKGGAIKSAADLKDRTIGIVSLSSGGIPLLRSFIASAGLDPDTDVTLIATGVGAPALTALQSGRVDALMYWSSALVGFINAEPEIDIIRDPEWLKMPDFTFSTSKRVMDENPKMVEGIARGVAKAMVFAAANPDCVRQIQWKFYPDTKPTGVDEEEAIRNELALLDAVLEEQKFAAEINPDNMVAAASVSALGSVQDFLFEAGVITDKVDPKQLVVADNSFWQKVNDFDKAEIEAQAKACELP